jgi:AcrR family transcriptional regulator
LLHQIRISILILMRPRIPYRKAFRPPKQARSQATLDRFVTAAAALLVEKRFHEASVQELVKRARSSVGAFYTRFADKDALMLYVYEQVHAHALEVAGALLEPTRWSQASTEQLIATAVQSLVERRREHAPLIRALTQYARSSPEPAFLAVSSRSKREFHQLVWRLLAPRRAEIDHPHPERAVAIALHAVDSAARDALAFAELPGVSDRELSTELTRMFVAHLGIYKPRARRRAS